jgi:alkylation response protein AidB-like acyl-CoA dehydrogenase
MNLLPTPEQQEIVDALSSFLKERAPVSRLRPPAPQIGNSDREIFCELGDLGIWGCALPEAVGGTGLNAAEEALIYRELGRHLLSPAAFALTLGAHLVAPVDSALLSKFMDGSAQVGIANPLSTVSLADRGNGTLHLFDSAAAEWILICDQRGTYLFRRDAFTDVQSVSSMDNLVTLHRARLEDAQPSFYMTADALHDRALLLLSAFAVGMAEAARDMAVEYAKTREQFGRPIGSFQAIKHICADMAIRCEAALCQTSLASLVLAEGHEGAAFHATASKLVSASSAIKNASENIQVHGAIGFTAEAEPHLFLKRAHLIEQLWGDTRQCRERLLTLRLPE